jgi:Icc-related predicted phosphoesterase
MTKVFFATDVHGSERVWRKWLAIPKQYGPDVIVLAGDLTGKLVVPIAKQQDGSYATKVLGKEMTAKDDAALETIKERVMNLGFYPYVCSKDEIEDLKRDRKRVDELFARVMEDNVRRWIRMAEEKCPDGVEVIVMPGNDDIFAIDQPIKESKRVVYPLGKAIPFCNDYELLSFDYSNPTPWDSPRECSEEDLWKKLDELASLVTTSWDRVICNFHVPPYGTRIDRAPKLDKNLKPKMSGFGMEVESVGSKSILRFMREHQPYLGLHGHIHESPGFDKVGKTTIFNPGSEYGEGILKGLIIELDRAGMKNWWNVSG